MDTKQSFVYILTTVSNHVLYTGVTSNLKRRIDQHKNHLIPGFTAKYNSTKLVYFEVFSHISNAIEREKQIKAGSRKKKIILIESINPTWEDLYFTLF